MDVEKLISFVYENKCLWDQSDPSYHLRHVQWNAWRKISDEMEISADEIKKKWRGLRDTFGRELKKSASETEPHSKWPYFKPLIYLKSSMSRRDLNSVAYDISDGEDNNTRSPPVAPEKKESSKKVSKSILKKKDRRHPEMSAKLLKIEEDLKFFKKSTKDPDRQFLMSLLPFMKDIPKERKLIVRSKLQQVFIDEQSAPPSCVVLYENSSESTL